MERFKVELLPAAYEDLNDIFDYILSDFTWSKKLYTNTKNFRRIILC